MPLSLDDGFLYSQQTSFCDSRSEPDASEAVVKEGEEGGGGHDEDEEIAGAGAIVDGALCALALHF